ncbi:MAG: SsrA-binding protein SmpB [Gammaproteobacteria bacterium]|nr:SsrA-binding protein SmpB [Gammaproteobacteria bacterium]
MAKKSKSKKAGDTTIARNNKARHDYFLDEKFEAGLVLEGWEVKSLREGKANLVDCYVVMQKGEAWLHGAHISPLLSASTHIDPNPTRSRKLLLHKRELSKIHAGIHKDGLTCVATVLYWKGRVVKCEIALARGKKQHDKRASEKEKDWGREKQRIVRHDNR